MVQLEEFSEAEHYGEDLLLNSWRNTELIKAFRIESQVGHEIEKDREGSPKAPKLRPQGRH